MFAQRPHLKRSDSDLMRLQDRIYRSMTPQSVKCNFNPFDANLRSDLMSLEICQLHEDTEIRGFREEEAVFA